ncbi:DNA-methyltransferase [Brevibacillus agri]|uniref:DNA-methyltransferase n=1 Tax=Brevibacillus agri TaxID=51101 RepID=UPI001EE6228F|nr:site-specific DNA-methyltransferase [Brevibacillus agri]MCG5252605.1 site-specific DNA-methyltransferase [Brevibacillus agri]
MAEKELLGSIELNRIYQRDCIEGMRMLPNESVDLIIADPPYNIGAKGNHIKSEEKRFSAIKEEWDTIDNFEEFNLKWLTECHRILRNGGSLLVWGSRHNIYLCGYQIDSLGLQIKTHYTWYKTNSMPCLTGRNPSESTEQLIWATKGSNWTYDLEYAKSINGGKNIRNVFMTTQTPQSEKKAGKHPSQKRGEGLTDMLIRLHSRENDIVVVPFCGSGTECVEAVRASRNFIAFETEPSYIEIANKRLDIAHSEEEAE